MYRELRTISDGRKGLLLQLGGEMFEVCSAGTKPTQIRAKAVAVMKEIGIDISGQWSKSLERYRGSEFEYVITVCDHAKKLCPVFPGYTRHIHWSCEDPATVEASHEERIAAFRRRCATRSHIN